MTTIIATESGTAALCSLFNKTEHSVFLPADICSSVLEGCDRIGVTPRFYQVERGWASKPDCYDLSQVRSGDLIVVSDLFNFRNIDLTELRGREIVFDLAHCSFATGSSYLSEIARQRSDAKIAGLLFSFGKGKYLRRGGGGCLVTDLDPLVPGGLDRIFLQLECELGPSPRYEDCDLNELFDPQEIRSNDYSTRIVVRPANFESAQEKIEKLRRVGKLDISDGLYNHLDGRRSPEFYVWKRVSS